MINIDKKDSLVSIKIIEPKGERQLKYMATVKEYYDELNGNSYWSCRVEDTEEDINYIFPFQYGYGTQSEYTVKEALRIKEVFGDNPVIKFIKITDCTEEEVREHGQGIEDNFMAYHGYIIKTKNPQ